MIKIGVVARSIATDTGTQFGINDTYLKALYLVDAEPIIINKYNIHLIKELDGILIPGGEDVDPKYYNQVSNDKTYLSEPIDDELDFFVIDEALKYNLPILGICRGLQVINVHFKGTLIQHIESNNHRTLDFIKIKEHPIKLINKSFLNDIMPSNYYANTAHHQAIDKLAEGFRIIALAPDGIIEAIEHETLPIIAFQWHPERLIEDQRHLNIFNYFINICKKSSNK